MPEGSSFCPKCGARQENAPASEAAKPKASGRTRGFFMTVVLFFLVFFVARQLSSGAWDLSFGSKSAPAPTLAPFVTPSFSDPVAAMPAVSMSPLPAQTPTPVPTPEYWNWVAASDDEIRAIMANFLCGEDPVNGYTVVFFCDDTLVRGGYFYWLSTPEYFRGGYAIGTMTDGAGDAILILGNEGQDTIRFQTDQADSVLFFIEGNQDFPNGVRLYRDDSLRDSTLDFFLSRKHTLNSIR